jgi:xanthine dehydrogenase YagS FAD-binding subunit
MEELAADPTVTVRVPLVREALLAGASPQLRNMATIGGNLLQRTRCRYFRDPTVAACNKRAPGSGCAAVAGAARMHAILGASRHCIALHASDLCVALVALDAVVDLLGAGGQRSVPLTEFYLLPGGRSDVETVLEHGELVTQVNVPLLPVGARSSYLKVRDRASYEFALTSAAAALVIEDGTIVEARAASGRSRGGPARPRNSSPAQPRALRRSDPPRRPRSDTPSPFRARRSRSSWPSARSSGSSRPCRGCSHDRGR